MLCIVGTAIAGPFWDDLTKCMVIKTTGPDNALLIQMDFVAMSSHPDVDWMTNISPEKKDEINDKTLNLLLDFPTVRCAQEYKQAFQYEGMDAFSNSFGVFGEVAMHGLMSYPVVVQYFSGL